MRRFNHSVTISNVATFVPTQCSHQIVVAHDRLGRIADSQGTALALVFVTFDAQSHSILRFDARNPLEHFTVVEKPEE